MRRLVIALASIFALIGTVLFSFSRLVLASFSLFTGPLAPLASWAPRLTVAVLLTALGVAIYLVHISAERIASRRGAWSALLVLLVSAPVLLAPFSVSTADLAAPLGILVAYLLTTRRYGLVTIGLPIAALIVLGYGWFPVLLLAALLVTAPLRSDPDPRLGELFVLTVVGFVVSGPTVDLSGFGVDRIARLGLVFVALVAFAVYLLVSRREEHAYPFIAALLSAAVLYLGGDAFGPLSIVLTGTVLVALAFESILRFIEVSKLRWKALLSIGLVAVAVVLTLTQSVFVIGTGSQDRMNPELAAALGPLSGRVGVSARYAPALEYFSNATAVPLNESEVRTLSTSHLTVPVLRIAKGRFSSFVLFSTPPYASDPCFAVVHNGVLVEVKLECSLS